MMKNNKWRYAITKAPAKGLNRITIPKATECEEKMNEKFLFHLLSCHGKSGRVSSSSGSKMMNYLRFEIRRIVIRLPARDCLTELGFT